MSKQGPVIPLVLEWSPRSLVGTDSTGAIRSFASFAEAATVSREVIVALSRRSCFVRTVRVPNAGAAEIRQVLMLRIADLFPLPTQDLAFDFMLTDDVSPEGRLALVAAVPSVELRRMHAEASAAGVRVHRIVPSAIGSMHTDGLGTAPTAVVQTTADGLAIDVVANGVLRLSRMAAGQASLEPEIDRAFTMAELPRGAVVAAGGLAVETAATKTKQNFLAAIYEHQSSLALDIELPEEVAARKLAGTRRRQRQAFLLCAAAAALGLFVFLDYQDAASAVRDRERRAKARVEKAQASADAVNAELAQAEALREELNRAFKPAQRFGDVTTVIANRTPEAVWLTGVTAERGKPMSVRGTAKTGDAVAAYLKALSTEPRLRDVKLVFASNSTIEQTPVVQFSLAAFPVGNIPLVEVKKKVGGRS